MRRRLLPLLAFALLVPFAGPLRAEDAAERERRRDAARAREAEEDARFGEQVNAAIDRGTKWLVAQQRQDGSYPGFANLAGTYDPLDVGLNALVMQTLAHCGVAADHDAIEKCERFCRFHYAGGKGSWNLKGNGKVMTYTAATLILAMYAVYDRAPDPPPQKDAYGRPAPPKKVSCKIPTAARKWIEELVEFLVEGQVEEGGWRYPGNPVDSVPAPTDMSNTQYALLALDAAARCGVPVPESTWTRAAEHLLREQEEEGIPVALVRPNPSWEPGDDEAGRFVESGKAQTRGWTYLPGHNELPTGSMTCAGIVGLGIVKERLWAMRKLDPALEKRLDAGMVDGIAWLAEHFRVDDNPDPPNQWHYYYLYGLERVGAKTGVRWLGRHDWYRRGAEHLLGAQEESGGWAEAAAAGKPADATESAITQTCFALLFLKRSTRPPPIPLTPPVLTGE
jgi:hypothetical protein